MNQTFQRGRGACVGVGGHCRARYHIAGYRIDGYHSVPLSRHDQRGQRNAIVALQEVPSKLASALEEEARRRGIHVEGSTDRSTHDPGDEADAPRVMLFVDRAELEDE